MPDFAAAFAFSFVWAAVKVLVGWNVRIVLVTAHKKASFQLIFGDLITAVPVLNGMFLFTV